MTPIPVTREDRRADASQQQKPNAQYRSGSASGRTRSSQILFTICLVLAGSLQLLGCGWLPPDSKLVGDLLLILGLTLCRPLFSRTHTSARLDPAIRRLLLILLIYSLGLLFYSAITYGEPYLVVRQARRWLIAAAYYRLSCADVAWFADTRIVRAAVAGLAALTIGTICAMRLGVNLPNPDISHVQYYVQGTLMVFKAFVPGCAILFLLALLVGNLYLTARGGVISKPFLLVAFLVSYGVFIELVPFRSWIVAGICSLLAGSCVLKGRRQAAKVALVVAAAFTVVCLAVELNDTVARLVPFITSAYDEYDSRTGSMAYRYDRDIARVIQVWSSGGISQKVFGLGFIHKDSAEARRIGFSTETPDTGWVEVVLTGGLIAAILFAALVFCFLRKYAAEYRRSRDVGTLTSFCAWLAFCALMLTSSNPFLWDVCFVPLTLMSLAVSRHRRAAKPYLVWMQRELSDCRNPPRAGRANVQRC